MLLQPRRSMQLRLQGFNDAYVERNLRMKLQGSISNLKLQCYRK